jgi:hypothetical protein
MLFNPINRKITTVVLAVSMLTSISSCKKDFGDINKGWKNQVYNPTIPAMFNGITASLKTPGAAGTVYSSFLYQGTQLGTMYASGGYRLDNLIPEFWTNYYSTLSNYYRLLELIEAEPAVENMGNIKAMAKTMMAYKALNTTMLFGDMPYTEAGRVYEGSAYFRPVYDPQSEIFPAALADLASAVNEFSTDPNQIALGGGDVLFKNDISKWVKFANSLSLRYAMIMREKNPSVADPIIAAALTKPLLEEGDNYGFYAAQVPDFLNNRRGYFDGNAYVRMGSTIWDAMSSSDAPDGSGIFDLRTKIFFEPNKAGEWRPYPQAPTGATEPELAAEGANNPYAESRLTQYVIDGTYKYSPFNFYYVRDEQIPDLFITSWEVEFLQAEIYNKGIGVAANPATAKEHYEQGITESVEFWYKTANSSGIWAVNKPPAAPTAAEMTAMLTHPEVAYSDNPATALSQIYKQAWIGFLHQPIEAWNLQRRTNYGTPFVPLASTSPVIDFNRFLYPTAEIEANFENWETVTGGADDIKKKPWFMN